MSFIHSLLVHGSTHPRTHVSSSRPFRISQSLPLVCKTPFSFHVIRSFPTNLARSEIEPFCRSQVDQHAEGDRLPLIALSNYVSSLVMAKSMSNEDAERTVKTPSNERKRVKNILQRLELCPVVRAKNSI